MFSAEPAVRFGVAGTSAPRPRPSPERPSTWSRPATSPASSSTDPTREGGAVAAAMEERGIPFHLAGPTALFQRPESLRRRDRLAAGAGRARRLGRRPLTRPPIELRSTDLARLTTIARRRKNSTWSCPRGRPRQPPDPARSGESGSRLFLKLDRAASAAMEERRADVFVRRLIERVGLRRQRLFAAQPEVAERLRAQPLAAGRAGGRLGAARAARLHPRLRPLPQRRRRGRGRDARRRGPAGHRGPRLRRRQGDRLRPRLRRRPRARRRRRADRQPGAGRSRLGHDADGAA